jgi:hypothetical protein
MNESKTWVNPTMYVTRKSRCRAKRSSAGRIYRFQSYGKADKNLIFRIAL